MDEVKLSGVRRWGLAGLAVLACFIIIRPGFRTMGDNLELMVITSRETARVWIEDSLPPGAKVAVESYAPFVNPDSFSVQGFGRMIDYPPEWYLANKFDYLIFSQGMFGRFYQNPKQYPAEVSQYDKFFSQFKLLKLFTDGDYEIRVYQVDPD
jgi:hypothetical protein